MSDFGVEPDDVVQLQGSGVEIEGIRTFTGRELWYALRSIKGLTYWVKLKEEELSIECICLKPMSGKGWQKGKICLRIEFIPKEPEPKKEEPLNEWEQGGR